MGVAEKGTNSAVCYGECLQSQGDLGTDKRFTGQRLDNTGLYYYGARYYDPTIGRFISADTIVQRIENPQSLNRYSYCLNNPLKYTDPTGHLTVEEYYAGIVQYGVTPSVNPVDNLNLLPIEKSQPTEPQLPQSSLPNPIEIALANGTVIVITGTSSAGIGFIISGIAVGGYTIWWGVETGAFDSVREWLKSHPSIIDNLVVQKSESSDTVQKGGKTVKDGTSRELNEYNDQNASPRDWGRALEELKKENGYSNNYHEGKITRDGSYYDGKGNYVGNLNDYLY